MTKEEAIIHMTLRREELKHSVGDLDDDIKAFDMAIKALEQQPCEDTISRDAAIDTISKIGMCKCNTNEIEAVDECLKAVKALPHVTPQKLRNFYIDNDYKNIRILALHACGEIYMLAIDANLTDTERQLYESFIIQEMSTDIEKSLRKTVKGGMEE